MRTPILRWLSLRLRIVLGIVLFTGSLMPPYLSTTAVAFEEEVQAEPQFLFVEEGFLMKASSIGEQGSRLAFSEGLIHTVQAGESLEGIAGKYRIDVQTIRWANGLSASAGLDPGQELVILPVNGVLHTVRRGETLGRIAQLYDVSQEEISRQNKIRGGFILAGQQVIIPGGEPAVDSPAVVASVNQALRFTDKLPTRQISLNPSAPRPSTSGGSAPSAGPGAGAAATVTLLQSPCGEGCKLTQGFRPGHYAIDMQVRGGAPIYSAEAGTVIRADLGYNGGFGNVIEIDHGNGLVTLYAHNKELYVKEGDRVERGQNIAYMGNTGRVHGPTGIHVHFEVRVHGVKKNPRLYLE